MIELCLTPSRDSNPQPIKELVEFVYDINNYEMLKLQGPIGMDGPKGPPVFTFYFFILCIWT